MTVGQVDHQVNKGWWRQYYFIGAGVLLSGLVVVALVFFWDDIQDAAGYGYAGCFVVSLMAGMTVIPAPAVPVVFTLGHKLSPLYIGLVAGLGEAIGGITIYLTGASGGTVWSLIRGKQKATEEPPSPGNDTRSQEESCPTCQGTGWIETIECAACQGSGVVPLVPSKVQKKQRVIFERVMTPMRHWGASGRYLLPRQWYSVRFTLSA